MPTGYASVDSDFFECLRKREIIFYQMKCISNDEEVASRKYKWFILEIQDRLQEVGFRLTVQQLRKVVPSYYLG
ncbi:hypothetical protein TNIN_26281 [Trichonephila inaurata madagascariensis]|uniref:Uncharacterized protein n=1 Tax=Trichonephila inaurata madagascariensis TaxID=2747483 RepID=A0A8X7CU34_9ARAC|nr:hypothetical protein TNIN_26281 [Trichonephila inaurata madagascariensis]